MAERSLLIRPLYVQLRDALAERIASGEWKPNAALPSEGDLAREFGVSSGTMRKALDLLKNEHLITRRQGRGTFVSDQSSDELSRRFTNVRAPDGKRILNDVRAVELTVRTANETECDRLSLQATDAVYSFRRTRYSNARPFLLAEVSMPASLFPGLEERNDFPQSIGSLAQQYGILLGKAEERISICAVSTSIAKALDVAVGSAVAVLDRVVRDIDGRPVEWRMAWCDLAENYYLARIG